MADGIDDNTARRRYELVVDGVTAYVDYVRSPGVVALVHTVVPERVGGRGIGSRLVRHALDDARRRGEKVAAQCDFVAAFIGKHAEYRDLLRQ